MSEEKGLRRQCFDQLVSELANVTTLNNWEYFIRYTNGEHLPYPMILSRESKSPPPSFETMLGRVMVFVLNETGLLYPVYRVPWSPVPMVNKYHHIHQMCRYAHILPKWELNHGDGRVVTIYDNSLQDIYQIYVATLAKSSLYPIPSIVHLIMDYADVRSYIM